MFRGWLQRKGPGKAAYALLLLLSSAGHAAWGAPTSTVVHEVPSIFQPHSGPANMINHLSLFVLQITGAIFIVVGSLWLYVVVRFRQKDPNDDSEPPQIYGSTQIELAWTVIPVLIVVVLFLTTARILSIPLVINSGGSFTTARKASPPPTNCTFRSAPTRLP
jgi:cytochrome c oxidase subunit II